MKRLERIVARLTPAHWPIRWRLAAVSAGLTFAILVVFALVVGRLVEHRLESNFDDELRNTAARLSLGSAVEGELETSELMAGTQILRIVDDDGDVVQPPGAPPIAPVEAGIQSIDSMRVATIQLSTPVIGEPRFLQYGRSTDDLEATINRLWLFLLLGVLGGSGLATLAGLAVAGRAMRPIVSLTATAREIASTRDTSRRVPQTRRDDEVAELARTLDAMLRELDAARTETEQMVQAQREFVADASHELRTPLTSILANLELVHDQLAADRAHVDEVEIVDSALRSSRRMRRLVADLLLLARADAGRTGARADVDLAEVAQAAVEEVRPVADGHRLALDAPAPVPVEGNSDELHRLAVNLLDNGVRHTPAGTGIEVSIARRNGNAVLEVCDDGPGLPPGMEEQAFSRFVRGEGPADLSPSSGAGLGLAIVRAVAASHGGEVVAGSSPAGGARFTVTLPLRESRRDEV